MERKTVRFAVRDDGNPNDDGGNDSDTDSGSDLEFDTFPQIRGLKKPKKSMGSRGEDCDCNHDSACHSNGGLDGGGGVAVASVKIDVNDRV
jgi:hypothetical protein